ncbi:MAG: hypothetical protein HQM09_02685 [Candidatus Riflebacteria bacterium]|nr:hypothetical protein [Candidatus Riflebacteria bacterium]
MWIALFDFCLVLLLVSFFLYGLREWDRLLIDQEDDEEKDASENKSGNKSSAKKRKPVLASEDQTPDRPGMAGGRFALWVLIIGLAITSLIEAFVSFWDVT